MTEANSLFSETTFDQLDLPRELHEAVAELGFERLTQVQDRVLPLSLAGRDVVSQAQTGSGKTATYLLAIFARFLNTPRRAPEEVPRALIVAPTRELAVQISKDAETLGHHLAVRVHAVFGGIDYRKQRDILGAGVDILIGTPGRLIDYLKQRVYTLDAIEVLVVDEADRMFDMGFLPDIRRILKALPVQRQTLFFSATMPKDIRRLADKILDDPTTVQIGASVPVETVSHALYPVSRGLKKKLLRAMLQQMAMGRVLIFTRTKYRARGLARDLAKHGYRVSALQGNMSQNQRQRAIDGFRDGKYDILVATDIAARGIDVAEISHVINFDVPDTVDAYTHRIGRTGRAHRTGEAFTFMAQGDEPLVREIEKVLGKPIERRRLPGFNYGGTMPESQSQGNRPNQPRRTR